MHSCSLRRCKAAMTPQAKINNQQGFSFPKSGAAVPVEKVAAWKDDATVEKMNVIFQHIGVFIENKQKFKGLHDKWCF